jgi:hypothetical protein
MADDERDQLTETRVTPPPALWTTVGSAGTLSAADLAKVSLHNAVIQLGIDLINPPPPATAEQDLSIITPQISAVVRYNVPLDRSLLFPPLFNYALDVTWQGTVGARLVQVDLTTGTETELVGWTPFPGFPPGVFFTSGKASPPVEGGSVYNSAYYVEATLVASATVVGNAAKIAAVKVFATTVVS